MRKKRVRKTKISKPKKIKKAYYNSNRNYLDPQYTAWRNAVKVRDNKKCRFPGCESRKRLQVHHIKKWSDFPTLRYEITNGITLCCACHKMVTGKEVYYEALFYKVLEFDLLEKIKSKLKKREDQNGG